MHSTPNLIPPPFSSSPTSALTPTNAPHTPSRPPRTLKPFPVLLPLILILTLICSLVTTVIAGRDYYDILGVTRDADSATIKRAFRKLAVKYHPDKNPGDKDAEKMYVELNNAYEVLADNSKREQYDMYGEDGVREGGSNFADDMDLSGFFNNFGRGQRRRRQQERRVPDVILPLSVSLEMLYNGAVITASHKRRVICTRWSECEKKCSRCDGHGMIITTKRLGPGFVQQMQTNCPVCGGSGKISNPKCRSCPNGQFEQEESILLVDVERGMTDGQTISTDSQTDEVPDHVPGNVHFEIITQEHDRFTREGNDLHYQLTITLVEALVGVDRVVKQLDGREVSIKTSKVISPKEKVVIPGEGMPSHEGFDSGNLIVEFSVQFPESLSEEQKKLAIQMLGKPGTRGPGRDSSEGNRIDPDEDKPEL